MSESFQIIFNSQGNNVVNNANRNEISYNVNWGAFLPKKYQKFECTICFKSDFYNGDLFNIGFINIGLGRTNTFDGLQTTTNMGIIYPVSLASVANPPRIAYYNSLASDNNSFIIDYPVNSVVKVSLKTYNGGDLQNMPHYCIMLNLKGIE